MNRVLACVLLASFIFACEPQGVVFNESKAMDSSYWNSDETVQFTIPQLDSLKSYNLFLNIRNTNDYKFNNIFLIVSMDFPHGKSVVDTLEYRMANPDGSWMGHGIGSMKESKLWYKQNVQFLEEGTYTIRLNQAMRNIGEAEGVRKLEGIADVGLTIEESSN